MQSKVPKGLATWAGLIAAIGQYALAVALFLDTFDSTDPLAGLGALATATLTLWKVIEGRMKQADTLAHLDANRTASWAALAAAEKAAGTATAMWATGQAATSGTQVTSTFTQPRPGAELRTADPGDELDPGPISRDTSLGNPELDDPDYEPPTREAHSRLKG